MSFGKLYGIPGTPRTLGAQIPAKANNLEIEVVACKPHDDEVKKVNPLGKLPAFQGANGFNLTEVIAIAVY
ncbi:hypothetical protein KEM55_000526, partial [Ascosphaera atra]